MNLNDRRKVLELFKEQKEYTEQRVNEGIDKFRKTGAKITVKDKDGKPVKNAKIQIKQTGHEFKYGANLFMLGELENEEKNTLYKKYMSDFGNMATLPFYWDATEPKEGETRYAKDSVRLYRRPPIDLCVEFCLEHGIEPREHALAYGGFFPNWIKGKDDEFVKKALEKRYKEISERYADKIPTIEVTNEMFWGNGTGTGFYEHPDFVKWCFDLARKYFPNNQLVVNDATNFSWADNCTDTDMYYSYIDKNLDKGAPIDAIGMQYHMFYNKDKEYDSTRTYYSPEKLYAHMDLYARFGKPLQITEVTIPAYSWEKEDEEIQAEIIENLYKIWFSHENVEQIIYWNMVDGYAHLWDPDPIKIAESQGNMSIGENYYYGGLLRFDLSPKPAYYTIKNLFEKIWHTEESLTLDESGKADFRGFYGDYEITVNGEVFSVTLSKNGESNIVIEV